MTRTWLDTLDPEMVDGALRDLDQLPEQHAYLRRADGDVRFSLWLRLVDEHIDGLDPTALAVDTRELYNQGSSPRSAAIVAVTEAAAQSDAERTVHLNGHERGLVLRALRIGQTERGLGDQGPEHDVMVGVLAKLTAPPPESPGLREAVERVVAGETIHDLPPYQYTDTPAWDDDVPPAPAPEVS